MDTLSARQDFEKKTHLTEAALHVLDEYAPVKTSMFAGLEGKKLIVRRISKSHFRERRSDTKCQHSIAKSKEIAEKKEGY